MQNATALFMNVIIIGTDVNVLNAAPTETKSTIGTAACVKPATKNGMNGTSAFAKSAVLRGTIGFPPINLKKV